MNRKFDIIFAGIIIFMFAMSIFFAIGTVRVIEQGGGLGNIIGRFLEDVRNPEPLEGSK